MKQKTFFQQYGFTKVFVSYFYIFHLNKAILIIMKNALYVKLVSAIFCQIFIFHQIIDLEKL